MKIQNNNSDVLVRYPLATAVRRFFAKFIDIFLVGIIVFGLGLAIIATDKNFNWHKLTDIQSWRYFLTGAIMLISFYGLMFLLPYFTNWTIGMKILKLKYIHILPLSNKFFNLFKHELLIWELMCILSFTISIILTFLNKPGYASSLLSGIQTMGLNPNMPEISNNGCYYAGIFLGCLYYCCAIALLICVIGLFVRNKKPNFYDAYSNIVVIFTSQINDPNNSLNKKRTNTTKINYGIPGEINSGAFEEIDKVE